MYSKGTLLLIAALTTSVLTGGASFTFGQQLRLDTQIESPAQNNNALELPEKKRGDTIQFQLFAPGAAGRQIQGYTIELALKGKTFGTYIDDVAGTDLNGSALLSRVSGSGNPTLSMLSLNAVAIPATGYLGQIDLSVSRALTSSDALMVQSASTAGPGGVQNLDVSQASLSFTARAQCPGDFNDDGRVDFADFVAFAGAFGSTDEGMDLNGDGSVGFADFVQFAQAFGAHCPTPPQTPPRPPPANTDREALVALYNATDGENWTNRTNWLSDRPLGEWYGVTTDASGRVTRLELTHTQLSGAIPAELGSLSNLKKLQLTYNQLSGSIPAELGSLFNLLWLLLSGNQLSGEIPPELGNLSNLTSLILDANQLSGEIPPELGNLSNLTSLILDANQLSGEIPPELGNLSNLWSLNLSANQLSGSIPRELGALSNLERLNLSSNASLSGPLPGSFTGFSVAFLDLENTQLCVPTDAAFQAWLQGVENKSGVVNCQTENEGIGTRRIYWTDAGSRRIQRANLDVSGVRDIVTGLHRPTGFALDPGN